MQKSKYLYREPSYAFSNVCFVNGVCSKLTLTRIDSKKLAKLNKDQLRHYILEKIKEQKQVYTQLETLSLKEGFSSVNVIDVETFIKAKVVEITLNEDRFWSLFTPWKFAYSYKGNTGCCSVFYVEL